MRQVACRLPSYDTNLAASERIDLDREQGSPLVPECLKLGRRLHSATEGVNPLASESVGDGPTESSKSGSQGLPTEGSRELAHRRDKRTRRTALMLVVIIVAMLVGIGVYVNDHPHNYEVTVENDMTFPVHLSFAIDGHLTFNGTLQQRGSYFYQGSDPWFINGCTDHPITMVANASVPSVFGGNLRSYSAGVGTCSAGTVQVEISLSQFY